MGCTLAALTISLSGSASCDRARLRHDIASLRALVPAAVPISAGGEAFGGAIEGARVLPRFSASRDGLRTRTGVPG